MNYADFLQQKVKLPDTPVVLPVDVHSTLPEYLAEMGTEPTHYIYGLYDPRDGELRYIGKSDRPRERYANQLNEKSNTHRCHWVQELLSLGLKPEQRIIDSVLAGSGWQNVERAYIRGAKAAGFALVNGTDGGDGVEGLSDEARAKMRATWLGRKHSLESREKMSVANRGRKHTQEYRDYMRRLMSEREFTVQHRERLRVSQQKLTAEQVREVRRLLASGEKQTVIAALFGVTKGSISNIKRGVTYSEVSA